jgi:hypothetical protein
VRFRFGQKLNSAHPDIAVEEIDIDNKWEDANASPFVWSVLFFLSGVFPLFRPRPKSSFR